ncbi:calcium-binding protein [Methylobrevis pamukkalensis]|uniref:Poly(Beta-D-mannuronate) C5 epimerase 1 n=1 Tax=Methylobrevis pamukkalensis TaxID=1439726 RepID=A0A1E3GZK9_9HYPH|nr:M10 family metallopeptidase C-terminal domain-containing protein [Methylobrevis pamukkalensis]ODN68996.1 Poly(beta-D-mannuronate) C5 epimerase 1 [Methylobrevis pamukkalensis]
MATIYGSSGSDRLVGTSGNDVIYGYGGNDDLIGGNGYNDYFGGNGADWFLMSGRSAGRFSDDYIHDFTFGADKVDVSAWGVSDFSQIDALLRADSNGDAVLNAFYGGSDHYLSIEGVSPGQLIASDFVYSGGGARTMTGTSSADVLFGSASGDRISGGNGADILLGGAGGDRINGGSGSDDLFGGTGRDILTGGSGEDAFVFTQLADSRTGSNRDVITDFQPDIDFIDLGDLDANAFAGGNQGFNWRGDAGFSGNAGDLRYSWSGGNTIISADTNGDRAADFQIELTGLYDLKSYDFVL